MEMISPSGAKLPRVSFILLAYNQDKFIDEAVAGALAQDYPNLEIILSDDNSTDATFSKFERRAKNYSGPHRLLLNREPGGRGILAHIYAAAKLASGELVVVAAGDDVSFPHRVSRLVERWQATGADALSSGFDRVDVSGKLIERVLVNPRGEYHPDAYFSNICPQISGLSAAYDRRIFDAVPLPLEPILSEDFFLSLVMGLRSRKVEQILESLVAYRAHEGSITHVEWAGVRRHEEVTAHQARMLATSLRSFRKMAGIEGGIDPSWGTPSEIDAQRLTNDIDFLSYRATWLSSTLTTRILALLRFRQYEQSRWLRPRLFGVSFLSFSRRVRGRMDRLFKKHDRLG